jgi:hypothetical protein
MGGWEWVVPVIIFLVYVINSFLRNEEKDNNRRRPTARPKLAGEDRPRRSSSDIDRFLDEVNRRRRQGVERRPATTERLATPLRVPPAPRPRPAARPGRERPVAQQPSVRPAPGRTVNLPRPPVEAAPVIEVIPAEIADVALARTLKAQEVSPALPPEAASRTASSPLLEQLTSLLSTPKGLQAGIVLNEVLGPPLSRRR